MVSIARLKEILDGIPKIRIAVVGDFFLDKILHIDRSLDEPSLETGLTAFQVTGVLPSPGAAGTVTNNLSALGVGVISAIGAIGDDGEGYDLIKKLRATGVDTEGIIRDGGLFTPTYTKPMFGGLEETHRLDIRNRGVFPKGIEARLIERVYEASKKVDAIIALDQVVERNTGVITDAMRDALAAIGRERPELLIFADSRAHIGLFRNIVIKCNHNEVSGGGGAATEEGLKARALEMSAESGRDVFVTWGERGIIAAGGGEVAHVPAAKVEPPIDICGAGDAATAGIVCALCCGASRAEAAFIGNLAAGVTIRKIGVTGTATRDEVKEIYSKM